MSGPAAGGEDHGGGRLLYGDQQLQPAADSVPLYHGDDEARDSVFFQSSASGAPDDYSRITDYLQGLLDPAGLERHLDAPPMVGDEIGAAAATVTPNSSTSETSDGLRRCKRGRPPMDGDQGGQVDEEVSADHDNCRSDTKEKEKKGKGEKKERGSRVAFATKSEVDHLDDDYRWRKYGQKAVKNSSFPRSYYRCTAARCGVKKLVERSQHDPSTVVTTYEGHHTHPSPIDIHRGSHMLMATGASASYPLAAPQHQRHNFFPAGADIYGRMCTPSTAAALAVAPMAHEDEYRLTEYRGMQLPDHLPDFVVGYQDGRH